MFSAVSITRKRHENVMSIVMNRELSAQLGLIERETATLLLNVERGGVEYSFRGGESVYPLNYEALVLRLEGDFQACQDENQVY
jgi:hypothetical protein